MNNGVNETENRQAGMARKTIYVGEAVLERAEAKAAQDGRSFSNYIVQLIRKDLADDVAPKPANGTNGTDGEERAA